MKTPETVYSDFDLKGIMKAIMPQAYIFDLDGTLMDTEILWIDAIEIALREKGCACTHEHVRELVFGRAWSDIYADIAREFPNAYPTRVSMEAVTVPLFEQYCRTRDVRIASSVTLLRDLSQKHPVGIVSGSTRSRITQSIAFLEIEADVDIYVGCEEYSPGKPDPAGFLLGARRLGAAPEACLVFEDSAAGVRAAKAAGMRCVALKRPGTPDQDFSLADAVLPDLAQFDPAAFCRG